MSWSIALVANTVKINKKCAKALAGVNVEGFDPGDFVRDGKLEFDPDHMEHMDYLSNYESVIEILKKNKVSGDITFADVESREPRYWGYRFDGKGGMEPLVGEVAWKVR